MRGCTVPSPHAGTHRRQNEGREGQFVILPAPCTHHRHGFQCCPGSHPCSRSPAFQNNGTHPPAARGNPKAPVPVHRSAPAAPLPSRCPPGPCTHRCGAGFLPGAGFSTSPCIFPARWPSFHKGSYSDYWYSCYRTSSCCFGFLSVLRGVAGRFR